MTLVGKRFGRLIVTGSSGKTKKGEATWACTCDCGHIRVVPTWRLKSGHTKSCGCFKADRVRGAMTTHGGTDTPTWRSWRGMFDRCERPTHRNFPIYGGRGISICERWRAFENFLADMGERPTGMTIDRIDGNGNYEPGNCRWATKPEQARNTRRNRRFTFAGETMTITDWSRRLGIPKSTVGVRLHRGWSIERALGLNGGSK